MPEELKKQELKKYIDIVRSKKELGEMKKAQWILCPICNSKTRIKAREDTELKNFPLYCPKCKKESLIEVKKLIVNINKEPDK